MEPMVVIYLVEMEDQAVEVLVVVLLVLVDQEILPQVLALKANREELDVVLVIPIEQEEVEDILVLDTLVQGLALRQAELGEMEQFVEFAEHLLIQ